MTIAQQIKVTEFPFRIKDSKGNEIYFEDSNKFWTQSEYDSNNNEIYYETSNSFWFKQKFDLRGNIIYYEDSDKFWIKREFDSKGNETYYETSYGTIRDNRLKSVPEYTMEELTKMLGKEFKITKLN